MHFETRIFVCSECKKGGECVNSNMLFQNASFGCLRLVFLCISILFGSLSSPYVSCPVSEVRWEANVTQA